MYKVFLAEDEFTIRNGIKNSVPWKENGLELVGEAADGELAYPLVLQHKPDILITDIKMPFMDGLTLAREVKKAIPEIKILILSGYDDFDYAREAISIGVTDYLLKPISLDKLIEVLQGVTDQIEKEAQDKQLMHQFAIDMQENVEFGKFKFFTKLLIEDYPLIQVLEEGKNLGMDLKASFYQVFLFKIRNLETDAAYMNQVSTSSLLIESLAEKTPYLYEFRRGVEGWAFLFLGDSESALTQYISLWEAELHQLLESYSLLYFFGYLGERVSRLRELKKSFLSADKGFANRFYYEKSRIIRFCPQENDSKESLASLNYLSMEENRKLIENYLRCGTKDEIDGVIELYFSQISSEDSASILLRQYIMMDVSVSIVSFAKSIKGKEEVVENYCKNILETLTDGHWELEWKVQLRSLLLEMIQFRDTSSGKKYLDLLKDACNYIHEHYKEEDFTLAKISNYVSMSPSYFSTIFGQEMEMTFVEYLTKVRMEKAKELLRCSAKKTSEIAYECGYKDAHYFSYIFRKTQNLSPREFRTSGKGFEE